MVLSVIEAVSANSKLPAVDSSMRTSTGERCGFGASAPSLTRASSMPFSGTRGSAILPKLVELVGSSSTRADEVSPYLSSSAATPSVRSRVFVSGFTSAAAAKRGC